MLMVVLSILVFASQTKAQITLMTQGWETAAIGTTPPTGWAIDLMGYSNWISFAASAGYPTATPYEGSRMVVFDSWDASAGTQNRLRMTTSVSTTGYSNITVDFAEYNQTVFTGGDGITVQYSTNGTAWTSAGTNWSNYNATAGWVIHTQALPIGAANQASLYVAFLFTSQYGYDVYLDICHINGTMTGNLTGTVRNCLTNNYIVGAAVSCGGVGPVFTNGSGVYTLNGISAGSQTITASFGGYQAFSAPVMVVGNTTTTYSFCMYPLPGILNGVVTNCANGNPIVGAKVTWGTYFTYSTAGGAYSMMVYSAGPNALQASKEGFTLYNQNGVSVTYPAPPNTTVNFCMNEDTPPPSSPFTAALNPGQTAVNLNWGLPVDDMVLIYDDGIQDNFAIWATGGGNNMDAMKFTPISYPTIVKGFYLNIGTANNYPGGSNPFTPIQVAIYSEVGGLPGSQLSTPTTITPSAYGWTKANFTSAVTIPSGNFFIVMIQLGASTASPGIAIDTTIQQMRSYSKFGTTPWIPGPGNYMIRAIVNGSGGPLFLNGQSGTPITASAVPGLIYQYAPATVTGVEGSPKVYSEMGYNPDNLMGYQVWRFLQGQEATPALWNSVGTPTNTNIQDNSWPSLPCGPYRWAAKAQYTFNRWSNATFSNVLGRCWTCNVTVNVDLSCDTANALGALVKFQNVDVTDTVYTYVMTATGTHTFTNFWKGNYMLTVTKFDYTPYSQGPISIMGDMTINVMLLQFKTPPTNLQIFDTDALATWNPPLLQATLFNEPFTGGFGPNGWVPDAGSNWAINAYNGNPGQCAEYYWSPEQYNYSQSLTSKLLTGNNSPILKLQYDVYLYNYGNTTLEQLAVEVWDGTTWHSVKNYDNSSGNDIPYTTETINIASVAPSAGFKVRFRAYGVDSYNIYNWDIDNVKIIAQSDAHDPCIIGYNFYLNGAQDGFTKDTFYYIPPSHLVYGTLYHACVLAVYGSGYSTQICKDFTSHFLCPPNTLTGTGIECSAYLTWHKPNCGGCDLVQYKYDVTMGNGLSDGPPDIIQIGNYFPVTPATTTGVIKSFDMAFSMTTGTTSAQPCILYVYDANHTLIGQSPSFVNTGAVYPAVTWVNVPCPDIPYTGPFYAMVDYSVTSTPYKNWFDVDVTTPQVLPNGLAFYNLSGTWGDAASGWGLAPPVTCMQRANVCVTGKDKDAITTIDPSQLPVTNNVTLIPSAAVSLGANVNITVDPPAPMDAPLANPVLLGYNIYRNGSTVPLATINNPNTLEYYDYNLNPGTYTYKVDALYNITPFNPPSNRGTSRKAGPVSVTATCGYPLPFFEPWDQASFGYQQWTFEPNQGNWSMNTALGDPLPCADFSWQPILTNYSTSLITPNIDASAWTCANIFCDFDYKLVDRNATGDEKLDIDIEVNGNWINKGELTNTGSVDWTLKHIDISVVKGKGFKVRFRANGANSGDLLHWYVDNIHLYGVCHPPETLTGHQNQFTTTLTWVAPTCGGGGPTPQWIHWDSGTYYAGFGYNGAYDWAIAARWTPTQIAPLFGGSVTKISFWPNSQSGSGSPTFRLRIWEGPMAANLVVDQLVPSVTFDQWNIFSLTTPHPIDISQELWIGLDINQGAAGYPAGIDAGPAVDNYGDWYYDGSAWATIASLGDSYNWNLQAYVEPSKKEAGASSVILTQTPVDNPKGLTPSISGIINNANNASFNSGSGRIMPNSPIGSQLMGYNIYSTLDNQTTPFHLVNISGPISPTTYQDVHPSSTTPTTTWKYFVTAVFKDSLDLTKILCEPSSDTITITFPAVGIPDLTNNSVTLYPNPANDVVNVVSTNDIKTIEVLSYIGQTIYSNKSVNLKTFQLNVSSFKAGVYFVKVTTVSGTRTTKITVTH
jgi:hypothetical protein